jgi:hypothetical protein
MVSNAKYSYFSGYKVWHRKHRKGLFDDIWCVFGYFHNLNVSA